MYIQAQHQSASAFGVDLNSRVAGHRMASGAILPGSGILSCFLLFGSCAALALYSERFCHWFLIPVGICGAVVGADAIDWIRGKRDLYDPIGFIGVFALHFFFLAPILHVMWNKYIAELAPPPDWRDWLGAMATLNAIGLIAYRSVREFPVRHHFHSLKTQWVFDSTKVKSIGFLLLIVTALCQVAVYARFGGVSGYMNARLSDPGTFVGMGWIFMISESFPVLAAFAAIAYAQQRRISWRVIAAGLVAVFLLQLIFGGLRGSRSQTVQTIIWVVGCVHLLIRPVPRRFVVAGSSVLLLFMYIYGFYKDGGPEAVSRALSEGAQEREYMAQKTNRTFDNVLLGDLARADIQAYILYALSQDSAAFRVDYAWGRTYLGALALLLPHAILPERPETKLKEGTEVQTGPGSYVPRVLYSSRVYGFAGESMLNFGPISVPIAYALFGLVVRRFMALLWRLPAGDSRFVLVPFAAYTLCIGGLGGDSDNLVFGLIKDGFMPALMVTLCSRRIQRLF
jgi:hypothetical protein